MFVMNRSVFAGTEGGTNSILMAQEGMTYIVKQTRAANNFLLFVMLAVGPQWPIAIYAIADNVLIPSIFAVLMLPLLWIWTITVRAWFKNPHIKIDIPGRVVILEKGRFNKRHMVIKPEHAKAIQIIYTIYQDSHGNTMSNFILEAVSPAGKARALCISDNLYLIRKIGMRMHEALGAEFSQQPLDDPSHSSLWTWSSKRRQAREEERIARLRHRAEERERRRAERDRRGSDRRDREGPSSETPEVGEESGGEDRRQRADND